MKNEEKNEILTVTFSDQDKAEMVPCDSRKGSVRRSLLKRVVGRKVLDLMVIQYHPNARLEDAYLKRQVSLRKVKNKAVTLEVLEIHYKLRVSDRTVFVRIFSVVPIPGGCDAYLYPHKNFQYQE